MRWGTQEGVDADEAVVVAREPRRAQPRRRNGRRRDDDAIRGHVPAVREDDSRGVNRLRRAARDDRDAARRKQPREPPAHARGLLRGDLGLVGHDRNVGRACTKVRAQSMRHRERDLDAGSAAADDGERADHTARSLVAHARPCREQAGERAHGNDARIRVRHGDMRRCTDIERRDVEVDRRAVRERRAPAVGVEGRHGTDDQPRAGGLRE